MFMSHTTCNTIKSNEMQICIAPCIVSKSEVLSGDDKMSGVL